MNLSSTIKLVTAILAARKGEPTGIENYTVRTIVESGARQAVILENTNLFQRAQMLVDLMNDETNYEYMLEIRACEGGYKIVVFGITVIEFLAA